MVCLFFDRRLRLVLACLCVVNAIKTSVASEPDLRRGLAAHYPLHEGQGEVVSDLSDHRHAGSVHGATWVTGQNGAALDFDGSREWVDCEDEIATRLPGPLTVSAWVRPIVAGPGNVVSRGDWSLSLDPQGRPAFTALPFKNRAWDSTQTIVAQQPLRANEWTLLTGVYDTEVGKLQLFVDGSIVADATKQDGAVGGGYRSKLMIGGKGYVGLVADVRLYDRALVPKEIEQLHQRKGTDIDYTLKSSAFRIGLVAHFLYEQQAVLGEVYLRDTENAFQVAVLHAELIRPDPGSAMVHTNKIVGTAELKSGDDLQYGDVRISTKGMQPGKYLLRVTANDPDGVIIAERTVPVEIPAEPWWKSFPKELDDSVVLPPWTPLKVRSEADDLTSIECWGRLYEFRGSAFATQINSADAKLLARPVQLIALEGGRRIEWKIEPAKLNYESPAKASWSRKLWSKNFDVEITTTLEYDGMLLYDVAITPKNEASIERMWLEVPFSKKEATLYYFMRDSTFQGPGAIPRQGLVRRFNQAIWIGNEQRGLQWFAESARDWIPTASERAIEIRPQDDEVVLSTNLIGVPVTLAPSIEESATKRQKLHYQFGLQATPVRPITNSAWDSRTVGTTEYGNQYAMLDQTVGGKPVLDYYKEMGVKTVFLVTSWTEVFSYPLNFGHKEELHRMTRECHARGIQVVLYFGPQFSDAAPEFPMYLDDFVQWSYPRRPGAPMSYYSYPDNTPPGRTQISYEPCIGSEWRNFLLAGADRLMDEFDIDGFYLDGVGLGANATILSINADSTTTMAKMCQRSHYLQAANSSERLYEIVKSHKPDGQVQLHPGSAWFGPVMSWSTVVWDGETILGDNQSPTERKSSFLTDYLTLEMFRAVHGAPVGCRFRVPLVLYPTFVPRNPRLDVATRRLNSTKWYGLSPCRRRRLWCRPGPRNRFVAVAGRGRVWPKRREMVALLGERKVRATHRREVDL